MGFNYIFWGLLCFLISFRVQGFDILPDFIGYILFIIGFTNLKDDNHRFPTARILSIILLILSLFDVYVSPGATTDTFSFLSFVNLIYMILNLVLIYHLCKGISEVALAHNEHQLVETAMLRWKLYFSGIIATSILFFLVFISPIIIGVLLLISGIYMFVVYCLIMGLTRQASRMIE